MSDEPRGLSCVSLAPGAPLCTEGPSVQNLRPSPSGQGAAAPGLPVNQKALNPFWALAPELLVRFLQLLGEL